MYTRSLPFALVLAFGLMLTCTTRAFSQQSQSIGTAVQNPDGRVQLTSPDLVYSHRLALAPGQFRNEDEAQAFWSAKNSPVVTFDVHFDRQEVIVRIETRIRPEWTMADWNEYLRNL